MLLVLILWGVQRPSPAQKQACESPVAVKDEKYAPGQVWSYKARPGESASTVTILRVETLPKVGVVIHVRVDGIQFKNCTGGPAPNQIGHAPFTKQAIDQSVLRLLRTDSTIPDYETGYQDWLTHCGGVYTIEVAKMVDVDDATFSAGLGCKS